MFVDIYTIFCRRRSPRRSSSWARTLGIAKRMKAGPATFHDFDSRFPVDDQIRDYRQIYLPPNPPLEAFTTPNQANELAKVANDGMAGAGAGSIPTASGLCRGAAHARGRALGRRRQARHERAWRQGHPAFSPTSTASRSTPRNTSRSLPLRQNTNLPIWLHPTRTADFPDYTTEKFSRYEMWWCFGWPYETSVARRGWCLPASSTAFRDQDHHPHGGGMIRSMTRRIQNGLASLGAVQGRGLQCVLSP